MHRTIPWLVAAVLLGCGGAPPPAEAPASEGQTLLLAVSLMCRADTLSGAAREADPLDRSQKRDEWLGANIKNPDAIYFRTIARVRAPVEHAQLLREQACELGIDSCPEADRIEHDEL